MVENKTSILPNFHFRKHLLISQCVLDAQKSSMFKRAWNGQTSFILSGTFRYLHPPIWDWKPDSVKKCMTRTPSGGKFLYSDITGGGVHLTLWFWFQPFPSKNYNLTVCSNLETNWFCTKHWHLICFSVPLIYRLLITFPCFLFNIASCPQRRHRTFVPFSSLISQNILKRFLSPWY